jgi:hypothetical protein
MAIGWKTGSIQGEIALLAIALGLFWTLLNEPPPGRG